MKNFFNQISIDLNEVEQFITSDEFKQFIIDNNTDFAIPCFIFQTLLEKIDELRKETDDECE